MSTENVYRHGDYIIIGNDFTAKEGYEGIRTLTIRKHGKVVHKYSGSSLTFSEPLTTEDKSYLEFLCESSME